MASSTKKIKIAERKRQIIEELAVSRETLAYGKKELRANLDIRQLLASKLPVQPILSNTKLGVAGLGAMGNIPKNKLIFGAALVASLGIGLLIRRKKKPADFLKSLDPDVRSQLELYNLLPRKKTKRSILTGTIKKVLLSTVKKKLKGYILAKVSKKVSLYKR